MTLPTSASAATYLGNGATTVFPFAFLVPVASDLVVQLTDNTVSPAVLTTLAAGQYTVTGIGNPAGGSVTCTDPATGLAIAAGKALTLRRVVAYVQTTSIVNQGGFYPDVLEGALDGLTMQTQQLAEGLSRAVQVPVGSGLDPAAYLPTIQASATTSTAAAASAAASAATASVAEAGAAASAAALPNAAAIGAGKVPLSTGSAWTGVVAGNMVASGVSTAGHVPRYTDATGMALADGYAVGATSNALVQLDATGKLPAVDGSQLTNLPVSAAAFVALQQDVVEVYLIGAINGAWAAGQYSNGGYDAFNSDTLSGVSGTSGQAYDATNRLYGNIIVYTQVTPTGATFGSLTSGGGLAAAFDGVLSKPNTSCAYTSSSSHGFVGKAFSSAQSVGRVVVTSSNNYGFSYNPGNTITLAVYGKSSIPATETDGTLLGSVTFADTNSVQTRTIDFTTAAYQYVWVVQTASATGNLYVFIAQVQYFTAGAPSAMTLVDSALNPAPATAPAKALLTVLWKDLSGSAVLNTDFTAEITHDGGTTWVAATLANTGLTIGGFSVLTASVALSGVGTTVQYRLKSINGKLQQVKAVGLMTQ